MFLQLETSGVYFLDGCQELSWTFVFACVVFITLTVSVLSACCFRPQRPHRHREAEPDEHGQAEHQGSDRVGPEPGPDPGLGLRPPAAVLRGDGALPEARPERYALTPRPPHQTETYNLRCVCDPSAKKTFLGQNKSFWGPLELVEKLTPEAGEITASVKDLPGLR